MIKKYADSRIKNYADSRIKKYADSRIKKYKPVEKLTINFRQWHGNY
jgi:hypothetical protein